VGRRVGGAATLAAAAVLAGLLLARPERLPPVASPPVGTAAATGFSVTAPPGRELIVLHTTDPKIVVVWYLPIRRSS